MGKVEAELVSYGCVIDPKTLKKEKDGIAGPGSISLSGLDMFVIMMLFHEGPS